MWHFNPSKLTIALFFLLGLVFPSSTYASQLLRVHIEPNGNVTFTCPEEIISRYWNFSGVYPTTGTPVASGTGGTVCAFIANGTMSMEGGFLNNAGNTPDGSYWTALTFGTSTEDFQYYWNSIRSDGLWSCTDNCLPDSATSTPTVPVNKNIEILNPTYGTTTATTTFQTKIKFKTPFSIDFRATTTRHFEIVDALTGELNYSYNVTVPANSSENIQITATTTTTEGSKYIRAMYLDLNGGIYSEVDEVFFNVATNTYFQATGLLTPKSTAQELTQIDCDTFDIGCQFQKAITFLIYPSPDILDKFSNLWQNIAEKRPFGYVTQTIAQLKELNTSGLTAFDLGTVPFMEYIFTPFRTLVASILWALFAIYFYRNRLIHLDI